MFFCAGEVEVVTDVVVKEIDNGVVSCFWDATNVASVGVDSSGV